MKAVPIIKDILSEWNLSNIIIATILAVTILILHYIFSMSVLEAVIVISITPTIAKLFDGIRSKKIDAIKSYSLILLIQTIMIAILIAFTHEINF